MNIIGNNKKLITYLGCGLLILAIIYFLLTVLKISGETFRFNIIEGNKNMNDNKKYKKTMEERVKKFKGENDKKGAIDKIIERRQKKLDELSEVVDEYDEDDILEKIKELEKIEKKIAKYETLHSVITDIVDKNTNKASYTIQRLNAWSYIVKGTSQLHGSDSDSDSDSGSGKGSSFF